MIISHSRKFIFIKTLKTGGTSLEQVLWRHCGPGDVLTPMVPPDEQKRALAAGLVPQNYTRPIRDLPARQKLRAVLRGKRSPLYFEHSPAWEVRRHVAPEIWNSYYKFCVVRHPFDRAVSRYYYTVNWELKRRRPEVWDRGDIGQFIRYNPHFINENWGLYTAKDKVILDKVVKYEDLETGLAEVSARIGLRDNLYDEMRNVRTKTGDRPKGARAEEVLDAEQRALVAALCVKEMKAFGYRDLVAAE